MAPSDRLGKTSSVYQELVSRTFQKTLKLEEAVDSKDKQSHTKKIGFLGTFEGEGNLHIVQASCCWVGALQYKPESFNREKRWTLPKTCLDLPYN